MHKAFDFLLHSYAEVIVTHGLNVQPGQIVNISAETGHRPLVREIVRAAYKKGASCVIVDLGDPICQRIRIEESNPEYLSTVPNYITSKYSELVDKEAANLRLAGSEFPEVFAGLDAKKVNQVRMAQYQAAKRFYDDGVFKSKVHWCVAAAATAQWAARIFPKLPAAEAERSLWDQIFKICRVDSDDPLKAWKDHDERLSKRAKALSEMKIKRLHFTGPGTDLSVYLSERSIWKGGGDYSARGVKFEPNIPTEECFTTPDWRTTSGTVAATRPILVNGQLIRDLKLVFKEGLLVDFDCSAGKASFGAYIDSDPGARKLGEVALVGTDSPIFQSSLVFEEILLDENAACHIAIGSAYKMCLKDGENLTPEQLIECGCNESSVHTDMMISSEQVSVSCETFGGERISLIERGAWKSL